MSVWRWTCRSIASPRAVSRDAGQPYCDRLLKLPSFLLEDGPAPSPADILAGFALTGHFLERDMLSPQGLTLPAARERLIGLLARNQQGVMPAKAGIQ